jgi:hypothetical protein
MRGLDLFAYTGRPEPLQANKVTVPRFFILNGFEIFR